MGASDLILAPRGTHASLHNDTREALSLLAVSVHAPAEPTCDPRVIEHLPALRQECAHLTAQVGQQVVPLNVGLVPLGACFAGAWGQLLLLEVPPGGCLTSEEKIYDENLFIVRGQARIQLSLRTIEAPFQSSADPTTCFNVFIPAGIPRRILNTSTTEALWLLIVQICHG